MSNNDFERIEYARLQERLNSVEKNFEIRVHHFYYITGLFLTFTLVSMAAVWGITEDNIVQKLSENFEESAAMQSLNNTVQTLERVEVDAQNTMELVNKHKLEIKSLLSEYKDHELGAILESIRELERNQSKVYKSKINLTLGVGKTKTLGKFRVFPLLYKMTVVNDGIPMRLMLSLECNPLSSGHKIKYEKMYEAFDPISPAYMPSTDLFLINDLNINYWTWECVVKAKNAGKFNLKNAAFFIHLNEVREHGGELFGYDLSRKKELSDK